MIMRMRCVACVLFSLVSSSLAYAFILTIFDGDCQKLFWYSYIFLRGLGSQHQGCGPSFSSIPYLGHSYILKYEYKEFLASQPAWVEEYFDTQNKRAKILAVSLGVEFADIYDYKSQKVMSYRARKPSTSGSDLRSQAECGIYDLKTFQSKYLHLRFPCRTKNSEKCDMPTADEVLRYGARYSYKYKDDVISIETRNIESKLLHKLVSRMNL
uniref:Putative secreted protein n=2 Tax=Ixodes ricinus TaxID=34613 RepID=V5HDM3_IXORI